QYKRANAALDLPVMPNSSFNEEVEARFKEVRARLDRSRKRLRSIEEGVGIAERRLVEKEPMIDQIDIEVEETRERLEKALAGDPKVLPITYEYAISGLT